MNYLLKTEGSHFFQTLSFLIFVSKFFWAHHRKIFWEPYFSSSTKKTVSLCCWVNNNAEEAFNLDGLLLLLPLRTFVNHSSVDDIIYAISLGCNPLLSAQMLLRAIQRGESGGDVCRRSMAKQSQPRAKKRKRWIVRRDGFRKKCRTRVEVEEMTKKAQRPFRIGQQALIEDEGW